jgi:hypothetical protein
MNIGEKIIDVAIIYIVGLPLHLTENSKYKLVRLLGLFLMIPWLPFIVLGLMVALLGIFIDVLVEI